MPRSATASYALLRAMSVALLTGVACDGSESSPSAGRPTLGRTTPPSLESVPPPPEVDTAAPAADTHRDLRVTVTLDGAPVEGAMVTQPGTTSRWMTDEDGEVVASIDLREDMLGIAAAHPDARTLGDELWEPVPWDEGYTLELTSIETVDNIDYIFQDPGTPERDYSTDYCSHCHVTLVEDWVESVHEQSARNPVVHDLYSGAAHTFTSEADCASAGGQWWTGIGPGTARSADRCYIGEGALPALNPGCGDSEPCDGVAENTGQCANCHAPGINGRVGGRDLLDATGIAYDHGVHCDVCHKISDVDVHDPEPGVGGRVHLIRPSEPSPSPAFGDWAPLTFGLYGDVFNPRMGAVYRPLFGTADLCAGCHELTQEAVVPGTSIDRSRWPDGRIPIQTTWSELRDGPLGLEVPCQSCHMPPDPSVGNSADLGNVTAIDEGVAGGWYREAGSVRRHTWFGPRSAEQRMLDLAAVLWVETEVADGVAEVALTTRNVGPGHALPTGEPMRHMVAVLEARCGSEVLTATGGDAVPDFGGSLAMQDSSADWMVWPGASAGEQIRVVARTGGWHDPPGTGPFGDGTFSAEDKGMPVEEVVGTVTIVSVDSVGRIATDAPIPPGDVAYRVDAARGLPSEGDAAGTWAGAPGFAFARVLADEDGTRGVLHFKAVDVVSDNRLPPQAQWTSHHRFDSPCEAPVVTAKLLYRAYPVELATERGWELVEQVMTEVVR